MTVSFGSGQTNGLPLLVTAITSGTAQTLHTAPAGSATPNRISIRAENLDTTSPVGTQHTLFIKVAATGGTPSSVRQIAIPLEAGLYDVLDAGQASAGSQFVLNGADVISVWADAPSVINVFASVDDQSSVAGAVSQTIGSGLIAAVQNTNEFGINAQNGTGSATEANTNIMMARAGTIRNLSAKASAAVGGGATVTVAVRKNGASSVQTLTLANADGTGLKTTAGAAITVVAGDLITILVGTDNAGAPAANIQAAFEFV